MKYQKSVFLALGLACSSLQAATTFIFNGTVTEDNAVLGFMTGDGVSYSITLSENMVVPYMGEDYVYGWYDELVSTDEDMFADLTGTSLTGTWTRPDEVDFAPFSFIEANNSVHPGLVNALKVFAGADRGTIGVSLSGFEITFAYFELQSSAFGFVTGTTEPDINDFFGGYLGFYTNEATRVSSLTTSGGGTLEFLVNSVTIETAGAIPEPSSYAAILSVAALAVVGVGRRRRL